MDFPDPVSEARRYCRHSSESENRCFRDKAWMGVGDAGCPSTWCTDSRSPSSNGGDENETGTDSEPRNFDVERSNSSASGLTGLTVTPDTATSFGGPEARFRYRGGSRFVTGVSGVFLRISSFHWVLFSCRDCLLANLSALGLKMGGGVDGFRFSGHPTWGSGPRENSGVATSSLPPYFDRGVRSLTRRVRDGSGRRISMSFRLARVSLPLTCV